MIRAAGPVDCGLIEAFSLAHIDISMFLITNLRNHGLAADGFASDHINASRIWVVGPGVAGVVAVTRRGMVMATLPDGGDLRGLEAALAGSVIGGAVGEAVAARQVLAALGLAGQPVRRDADEPGFALYLTDLQVPDTAGMQLIRAEPPYRDLLVAWRSAYCREVMGAGVEDALVTAKRDIETYIAAGSHRVLLRGDVPVAMTGFNAALPEIVQIGGVYVPPALRKQGLARRAVALHLLEARMRGVSRAVLFAANDAAARAYRAIGFQRKGTMALVLFEADHRISA